MRLSVAARRALRACPDLRGVEVYSWSHFVSERLRPRCGAAFNAQRSPGRRLGASRRAQPEAAALLVFLLRRRGAAC